MLKLLKNLCMSEIFRIFAQQRKKVTKKEIVILSYLYYIYIIYTKINVI